MLFVGDLLQLHPVNGKPVFEKVTRKAVCHKLGCATAVNIWGECVEYDELTINERQKNDEKFSSLLGEVRQGSLTDEAAGTLSERVIEGSATDKYLELQNSDTRPVCLFPTRKACEEFNKEMLQTLDTEVHELACIDEVDETRSMSNWHTKAAEKLEKMNSDCNNTEGLEAKLQLAVGARVMLRRNIDTKLGLVNGAIGTVLAITSSRVRVKFDHLDQPYDVERVRCKFMVMKKFFIYRQQFPLMLAYAITIHKSQGLSLDCAIGTCPATSLHQEWRTSHCPG